MQTDADEQTDKKKLIVPVGNFANVPTKAIMFFEV
jgi:hypothetical protein